MKEKETKTRTRKNPITVVQSAGVESSEPKKMRKKASPAETPVNGAAATKKNTRTKATSKVTQIGISHEEIAKLAHRYWAERGCQDGNHVDDWLRAERELLGKAS